MRSTQVSTPVYIAIFISCLHFYNKDPSQTTIFIGLHYLMNDLYLYLDFITLLKAETLAFHYRGAPS